MADLQLEIP